MLGIVSQNKEHLDNINFDSTKYLSRYQFKKVVEEYIIKQNKDELVEDSRRYKKIDTDILANEEFKRKPYFNELNLSEVRDIPGMFVHYFQIYTKIVCLSVS